MFHDWARFVLYQATDQNAKHLDLARSLEPVPVKYILYK